MSEPGGAEPPIIVQHAAGSYPIHVERGALARLPELIESYLPGRRPFVIADAAVAALYGSPVAAVAARYGTAVAASTAGVAAAALPLLTFPAGEASKTRDTWVRLTDELLAHGAGRDSAIIALGGGVTGDLAGFVAATFHRGIPILHLPTTLLAMVDSSIGGKSGVDTGSGKNLVGAFHQPVAVIADPDVLTTLDDRHFRAGLAEAVKHGWMLDRGYFQWLEAEAPLLGARDAGRVAELIRWSVRLKAEVVAGDERDEGRRAALNAGHTVGHAIEHASGWTASHGDAVAVGLVAEAEIAVECGLLDRADALRLRALLARLGLPVTLTGLASMAEVTLPGAESAAREVVEAARADKKNRTADGGGGATTLRCALAAGIGRPYRTGEGWTTAVDPELMIRVLDRDPPR